MLWILLWINSLAIELIDIVNIIFNSSDVVVNIVVNAVCEVNVFWISKLYRFCSEFKYFLNMYRAYWCQLAWPRTLGHAQVALAIQRRHYIFCGEFLLWGHSCWKSPGMHDHHRRQEWKPNELYELEECKKLITWTEQHRYFASLETGGLFLTISFLYQAGGRTTPDVACLSMISMSCDALP
jgi:hypothetical protein